MRRLGQSVIGLFLVSLLCCGELYADCIHTIPETSYSLIPAGSSTTAGVVNVTVQNNTLRLYYSLNKGWAFAENEKLQLWAGNNLNALPVDNNEKPNLEKFPYISSNIGKENTYLITVPLSNWQTANALYVFTHVDVKDDNGKTYSLWLGNLQKSGFPYFKVDLMNQCSSGNDIQKQLMKENPAITYVPSPS